eukprot:CAMPEP_0116944014 /NCGR_PEP_ID=MMETSP0467-20121206/35542_1 /TAXON_ID=283647 /ORGANISM="Mesodinium pulex, Strain SPMC105" /LENGTH=35 /DNA_ID= /DNA_START= /DNA_END= /DNA_ORIENTATION=
MWRKDMELDAAINIVNACKKELKVRFLLNMDNIKT